MSCQPPGEAAQVHDFRVVTLCQVGKALQVPDRRIPLAVADGYHISCSYTKLLASSFSIPCIAVSALVHVLRARRVSVHGPLHRLGFLGLRLGLGLVEVLPRSAFDRPGLLDDVPDGRACHAQGFRYRLRPACSVQRCRLFADRRTCGVSCAASWAWVQPLVWVVRNSRTPGASPSPLSVHRR